MHIPFIERDSQGIFRLTGVCQPDEVARKPEGVISECREFLERELDQLGLPNGSVQDIFQAELFRTENPGIAIAVLNTTIFYLYTLAGREKGSYPQLIVRDGHRSVFVGLVLPLIMTDITEGSQDQFKTRASKFVEGLGFRLNEIHFTAYGELESALISPGNGCCLYLKESKLYKEHNTDTLLQGIALWGIAAMQINDILDRQRPQEGCHRA